jgi:hypothetical protein
MRDTDEALAARERLRADRRARDADEELLLAVAKAAQQVINDLYSVERERDPTLAERVLEVCLTALTPEQKEKLK